MTDLGLHESGMSPRSVDDRPVHLVQWESGRLGVERVMTRAEAVMVLAHPPKDDDWLGLMNYGTALYVLGDSDRSRAVAAKAAQLHPNSSTLLNLAVILEGYGEFDKSLDLALEAVKRDPTNQFAGLLWAQGMLRQGRWAEGWEPFCWFCWGRIWAQMEEYVPEWRGEDLNGKHILVLQGGGFGDNLMFFRWLGELKKMGAHVTYACPGPVENHPEHKTTGSMVELLTGHPWVDVLIPTYEGPETDWLPEFDAHILKDGVKQYDFFVPIMGIPRVLKTTVENVPGREPYIAGWNGGSPKLGTKKFVGVSWKAGEVLDPRRHRSLNNDQAKKLMQVDTVEWVSLQLDKPPLPIATPDVVGWTKTRDVIADLDMVVTVDSSVAHLAGAMGVPTLIILPGLSDWKWLLDRTDSVFYPSARLFRNPRGKTGMDDSLDAVIAYLKEMK